MNAIMTFIPGLNLQLTDAATLSFWTKHYTELNKDICYLEVSGDSMNWSKVDSFSGSQSKWKQHEVDLKKTGYAKIWIRFHFISDNQNVSSGVKIDDVEIFKRGPANLSELSQNIIPKEYKLSQNYPNPFNPSTTICFNLPLRSHVLLQVYDLLGRKVATMVNENLKAGSHTAVWNATGFASGVYLYRLQAGDYSQTKKLVLLR